MNANQFIKDNLIAVLAGLRSQQEEIGRLKISLESVVESLKQLHPETFETEYRSQVENQERGPIHGESERMRDLIETATQTVREWDPSETSHRRK